MRCVLIVRYLCCMSEWSEEIVCDPKHNSSTGGTYVRLSRRLLRHNERTPTQYRRKHVRHRSVRQTRTDTPHTTHTTQTPPRLRHTTYHFCGVRGSCVCVRVEVSVCAWL